MQFPPENSYVIPVGWEKYDKNTPRFNIVKANYKFKCTKPKEAKVQKRNYKISNMIMTKIELKVLNKCIKDWVDECTVNVSFTCRMYLMSIRTIEANREE